MHPNHATFGIFVIRQTGLVKIYPCAKFEFSSFTHSKFPKGFFKFENSALDADYPPLGGNFVVHEMGHAKVYQCTKFEISSFTRSKFTEGGLKFKNSAPRP